MKKVFFLLAIVLCAMGLQAQTYDSIAPYKKDKAIPDFNILQTDSSWFSRASLPSDKPVVFVYFNPDCGHCQATATAFAANKKLLNEAVFIWVTYLAPLDEIAGFAKTYHLEGNSNVHFGKDPKYFIPSFFRVEYTPFIALYGKDHKFYQAWVSGVKANELEDIIAQSNHVK